MSDFPNLFSEGENGTEDRLGDDAGTEVFASSDPNLWDYIRPKDFTKKTGIAEQDCHAFAIKELSDNSADFIGREKMR
jgi:hypothetical protein